MLVAANKLQTVNTGTTDSGAVIAELQEYYMKLHSKTLLFEKYST